MKRYGHRGLLVALVMMFAGSGETYADFPHAPGFRGKATVVEHKDGIVFVVELHRDGGTFDRTEISLPLLAGKGLGEAEIKAAYPPGTTITVADGKAQPPVAPAAAKPVTVKPPVKAVERALAKNPSPATVKAPPTYATYAEAEAAVRTKAVCCVVVAVGRDAKLQAQSYAATLCCECGYLYLASPIPQASTPGLHILKWSDDSAMQPVAAAGPKAKGSSYNAAHAAALAGNRSLVVAVGASHHANGSVLAQREAAELAALDAHPQLDPGVYLYRKAGDGVLRTVDFVVPWTVASASACGNPSCACGASCPCGPNCGCGPVANTPYRATPSQTPLPPSGPPAGFIHGVGRAVFGQQQGGCPGGNCPRVVR